MYSIKGHGIIWDKAVNKPLVKLKDGGCEFEDKELAEKLYGMGYKVEGYEPEIVNPLDGMTVKELQAYATEKGISLDGITKKEDILAAITAAEA